MARAPNPYMADSGPYAGIGEGVNNLAQVFLNSQPDPAKAAQAQAYAWRGRESRENVLDSMDARQGRHAMGEATTNWTPDQGFGQLFGQAVGTGAFDPEQMGTLARVLTANMGGSDDQLARSVVGAGTLLGENDFVSRDDREMGRSRTAANDRALDRASMTLNERLGDAFASGQLGLEEIYGAQYPNRYADAAETQAGGGEDGLGGADWLEITRRNTVEEAVDEAINNFATDQGLEVSAVPAELRTLIVDEAIRGIDRGDFASPRAAAGTLLQQYNARGAGQGWWDGDPRLEFDAPAAQPRPNQAQPGTPAPAPAAADPTLQDAMDAVGRGADPGAVRERLYQMGYTDDQLSGVGL